MQLILNFFLGIVVCLCAGSCKPRPSIHIKYIGELKSRKSYAAIQFIDADEDSISSYVMKQQTSEPWIYTNEDSLLISLFQKAGYVSDEQFLLSRFKADTAQSVLYKTMSGEEYNLYFYTDTVDQTTHFTLTGSSRRIDINTNTTPLQNLDYAFIDLIPGGNKELVFLDDYYIMNGDNYHFKVYEITAP